MGNTGDARVMSPLPHLGMDDTCGQNRTVLGNWFINHGGVDLLLDPRPPLVGPVVNDPYQDPSNPPIDPNVEGVCSMRWSEEKDPSTNHLALPAGQLHQQGGERGERVHGDPLRPLRSLLQPPGPWRLHPSKSHG